MTREPREVDYLYELTPEELRYSASLDDLARLTWLDQARRFTLLAREAEATVYHAGRPVDRSGVRARPDASPDEQS